MEDRIRYVVSPYAGYKIKLRDPRYQMIATEHGTEKEEVRPFLVGEFQKAIDVGVPDYVLEAGLAAFPEILARGMPQGDDDILEFEGRFVTTRGIHSPAYKLGVLDLEQTGWSEEERAFAEEALQNPNTPGYGGDWIVARPPEVAPPFPTWDELRGRGNRTTAQLLAERVTELGLNVAECIEYESTHQDREDVLNALLELVPVEEEVPSDETIPA